jgi:hypothetical protein
MTELASRIILPSGAELRKFEGEAENDGFNLRSGGSFDG